MTGHPLEEQGAVTGPGKPSPRPSTWTSIPAEPPPSLVDARVVLHWAAQLLGGAADALIPAASDDSHTNLFWREDLGMLAGRPLSPDSRLRLGLDPRALSIVLLDRGDAGGVSVSETVSLPGTTLEEAGATLSERLSERVGRAVRLDTRDYDMPDHGVARGEAFPHLPEAALRELAAWYGLGTRALEDLANREPRAVPVAIWPHHFDIGTIVFLGGAAGSDPSDSDASEGSPQIGVGLSPGDGTIPHPYFYVTPWPVASWTDLPSLPAGRWNTEGFNGAVLEADEIRSAAPSDREGLVAGFLSGALAAGEALIHRPPR